MIIISLLVVAYFLFNEQSVISLIFLGAFACMYPWLLIVYLLVYLYKKL